VMGLTSQLARVNARIAELETQLGAFVDPSVGRFDQDRGQGRGGSQTRRLLREAPPAAPSFGRLETWCTGRTSNATAILLAPRALAEISRRGHHRAAQGRRRGRRRAQPTRPRLLADLRTRYSQAVQWESPSTSNRDWAYGDHLGYALAHRLAARAERIWISSRTPPCPGPTPPS
jgi:hypothetical protein